MKSDIGTNNKEPSISIIGHVGQQVNNGAGHGGQQVNKGAVIYQQNDQSKKTKKVRFADESGRALVNVIDVISYELSAIDEFLQPDNFHIGDPNTQRRLFKAIRALTDEKAQNYKHCFIKRLFSDTCKKEHAIYKAYQYMKKNITINEDDKIVGLENLRQHTLNIINQWNACCGA